MKKLDERIKQLLQDTNQKIKFFLKKIYAIIVHGINFFAKIYIIETKGLKKLSRLTYNNVKLAVKYSL